MGKNQKNKYKLILFFLFILSFKIPNIFNSSKKLEICLCSPVKKENIYLEEFVEYYKSYNVDKIFLYDNNEIDGEHLEYVINDYVESGFVKIIDFRGKKHALYEMMNDCYKNNYLNYDWLIFYEIDEYIHLRNYSDIKKFLGEDKFKKCQTVQLNWVLHTDNGNIYYENKPLAIRFPNSKKSYANAAIKSILRGRNSHFVINCVHKLNEKFKTCDGFGRKTHIKGISTDIVDNEYYYIDHYFCKSTEEFINKINKGDVLYFQDNFIDRIRVYFEVNKVTNKKIDYIKNHLHTNISFENILHQINYKV